MGSRINWSWVTANGGWMLTVSFEVCITELAFSFTWRERIVLQIVKNRDEKSWGHSPGQLLKGWTARQCQESELAAPKRKERKWLNHLLENHYCVRKLKDPRETLLTDGSSMLEDTATLTVRSSSVMDLGRMSEITAEDWDNHYKLKTMTWEMSSCVTMGIPNLVW